MASRALKIDPQQSARESVQPTLSNSADQEIAALAYQFWLERGCPIGSDQEDWFRAERELALSKRTDDEEVESFTELSIVYVEEADSPSLRFPVRSELSQPSHQRLL